MRGGLRDLLGAEVGQGLRHHAHDIPDGRGGFRAHVVGVSNVVAAVVHDRGVVIDPVPVLCRGAGYVASRVTLNVRIPAGVEDGMRVRVPGEGEPSGGNGPSGDLYCFVSIRPHKLFHRDHKNLILQWFLTYSQAALGATINALLPPSSMIVRPNRP